MDIINKNLSKVLAPLKNNEVGMGLLKMSLILYGGLAAPTLPPQFKGLFDNAIFRMIALALILYINKKDPATALIVAVVFTVSVNLFNKMETQSVFKTKESAEAAVHNVKLLVEEEELVKNQG